VTANLRFGRDRRLTLSAEFARVRTEGQAQRGAFMLLGVLNANDGEPFRAGFVTSKRIGGAVVRNCTRRRLREIVRKHQHAIRDGVWLVVVARPAAARASYSALEDEWLRLATRTSILRPSCS
jgi:ribonuclease P protein component